MGQRLALIIGNSAYLDGALSRLLTPDADVGALGEILLDPELGGFDDVNVLVNMSSHIIRRSIAGFFSKKAREDLLLLYFSGHGVLDDQGHLYLAVRDTDSKLLRGTAISASYITDEMNNSRSQRQLLILDCCHSGAFARGTKGKPGARVGTGPAFEGTGFGRVVLTASDATQYAWEGDQVIGEAENSLFTHFVLLGIKSGEADLNGDGQITIDELYDYVYERVVRQTPKQTPGKWSYKERGEIVISRAPGVAPEAKAPVSLPEFERDVQEKLEKLYNEGLSAYWLEDWDKAVRCFQAILAARPGYPDAANKLELSRRKQQIHRLYERALSAEGEGDWPGAITNLNELLAIEPEYQDAAARLEHAKRNRLLGDLYAEALQLSQAGKWQAVVNVFAQIASLAPDYPDPEGLLGAAQAEVAEQERLADLERRYSWALREMDAGRWSKAEELLVEVQEMEPGYQAADRLLERAKLEGVRQQEARQLEEQVSTLYQQALGLRRAKHWRKALEKMEEICTLSPEFEDAEGVIAKARVEIEREEEEAKRQQQLAEMYAAAVSSLEAGQYQLALEQWNEVQSLDPKYPDQQRVLKTARKKLKELSKAEAPKPEIFRQRSAWYALGGIILLGVLVFLGIRSMRGEGQEGTPAPAGVAAAATKKPTVKPTSKPTTQPVIEQPPAEMVDIGGVGYSTAYRGKTVKILYLANDEEARLFQKEFDVLMEKTGITIHFEKFDNDDAFRSSLFQTGNASDIAVHTHLELIPYFVRSGKTVDVDTFLGSDFLGNQYNPALIDLSTVDGKIAGVWRKMEVKSLVWYPKKEFDSKGYQIPATWDELKKLSDQILTDGGTPWCIGIESGYATGWVGTDWVEDVMLRTTSPENYDLWTRGDLKFQSPEVKNAFDTVAEIWFKPGYVYAGVPAILTEWFADGPGRLFDNPPKCWLYRQASFIRAYFPENAVVGEDIAYFYLPPIDPAYGMPILGWGTIASMFNDRPEVREVMKFLATGYSMKEEAMSGIGVAPHLDADPSWYPDDLMRGYAEIIHASTTYRLDGSDLMPSEVGFGSFWEGIIDWVAAKGQNTDEVLKMIDNSWPKPNIRAHLQRDSVDAWNFPQDVILHLAIDDPKTPVVPDLEMNMPGVVDPELGSVWFELAGTYDLKAGDEVTLSDGTTTRHLVVSILTIDAVDVEADTVQGVAEPGEQVDLPTLGEGRVSVTADSNGYWLADFRQIGFDLLPGMGVIAEVFDEDGDLTSFEWKQD